MISAIMSLKGVSVVPDLNYNEPEAALLLELTQETKLLLQTRRRLYLLIDGISRNDVVLKKIENKVGRIWYSITAQEGGPFLILTLPPCYQEKGKMQLAAGSLSVQKLFLDPVSNTWQAPPVELVDRLKEIVRMLKTNTLQRYQLPPRVWIGKDALLMVESGMATINGYE